MTKKDIVRTISEEVGLTQQQTKEIVQKTFDAIVDHLIRERRIELRNFGVFEVKPRAARRARNPRTGQKVNVPKKHVVTFKPGKYIEARVRDLDEMPVEIDDDSAGEIEPQNNKPVTGKLGADQPPRPVSDSPSGRWDTE
ncbi:MAG: integration host factor subunit beta [Pirellulales bacterium]|nr:integration host factor subunit beta [Pirellulales bacterium]